jgi:hypothetical protein
VTGPPDPTEDDRPWSCDGPEEGNGGHFVAGYVKPYAERQNGAASPPVNFGAALPEQPSLVRCLTADEFFAAESTANLVVPSLGICPGPPTGFVGQAYVGKTIVAFSFGLSVALGRNMWGVWPVQQGPWLHLDYEQGRRHTKARIHRLARGFGVPDELLRELIANGTIRIAVLPDLRLTTDRAADHFKRAFEGARLVTCDSLRPMLGGVDENSSQVRALMGSLTAASDASAAAVALLHHGGKTPIEGGRPRKETPRGSSGIIDEFQSFFVMTKAKGEPVALVTHEKDRELGLAVADFGLCIEDVPTDDGNMKGGLRVVHLDREQMTGKGPDAGSALLTRAIEAARACVRENPGIAGAEAVAERVQIRRQTVSAALKQLVADGEVIPQKSPRGGVRLFLTHMAPPEAA